MEGLPPNKTKIVCTLGPASESQEVMERMLLAGMNVARLNFSHGDFESHKGAIDTLRSASRATGRRVAIMADLSGPKMRIGKLKEEPVELKAGDPFTLTTKEIVRRCDQGFGELFPSSKGRQARRHPLFERRFYSTGSYPGEGGGCPLQSGGGRGAAFAKRVESSGH